MILALTDEAPDSVRATGRAFVTPGIIDEARVDLGFSDRRPRQHRRQLSPFKEQKLVLVGETGALVFDDVRPWPEELAWRQQGVTKTAGGPTASGAEPGRP